MNSPPGFKEPKWKSGEKQQKSRLDKERAESSEGK
jgi:hypothetical protein